MTTTLATFHGSALRVELLQRQVRGALYLREVFLRTLDRERIVEYGVIAIALDQFEPAARDTIHAHRTPLGAVLHQFKIPFVSAPIGFFAVSAGCLASTPLAVPAHTTCYGRFNRLAKPTGEALAWILEIIPPP